MNYLLKITFSLLLVQLVIASETEDIASEIEDVASEIEDVSSETDGVPIETEISVDAVQEAHEREHLARRADFIANRANIRKHPPPPVNVVPNEIDERYKCIPYSEYIVSALNCLLTKDS